MENFNEFVDIIISMENAIKTLNDKLNWIKKEVGISDINIIKFNESNLRKTNGDFSLVKCVNKPYTDFAGGYQTFTFTILDNFQKPFSFDSHEDAEKFVKANLDYFGIEKIYSKNNINEQIKKIKKGNGGN